MDDNSGYPVKREMEIGHMDTARIKVGCLNYQLIRRVLAHVLKPLHSSKEKRTTPTHMVAQGKESLFWEF